MSRGLAEQIALLDGLSGDFVQVRDQINASNGGNWSGGANYPDGDPIPLMTSTIGLAEMNMQGFAGDQDVINQYNAINASNGANYSGGSNYEESIPLMTSSIGLAGLAAMNGFADQDLLAYANGVGQIPNTLPPRFNVIDASGGANYSGGASFSPFLPLLPSRAGLAGAIQRTRRCPGSKRMKILQARVRAQKAGDRNAVIRFTNMLNRCSAPQVQPSPWK